MAVIEIAKIQVRRGQENQTGIPQLDSGEFGWAVDSQKLYIGNGSVSEGAPAVGNTEILTEHTISNLFNLPTYTYGTSLVDLSIDPGTQRTIFAKLDDFINVADFGVVGDGVTDVTVALQNVIDQIFLSTVINHTNRKKLYFSAGTYMISSTIYVPPYATFIGDGIDKTILVITEMNTALLQFVDGTSTPGIPIMLVQDENYIQSATKPRGIHLEGITLNYSVDVGRNNVLPLLRADCVEDSQIINCKFSGHHNVSVNSGNAYVGIEFRSQPELTQSAIPTKNILIKDCIFSSLKYGILSNYDIEDITVVENKFDTLYKGIVYNLSTNESKGPSRSKIGYNKFEDIEYEAIYVGDNNGQYSENVSMFNSFREVGNKTLTGYGGDFNGQSSVITFLSKGNISVEDKFSRDTTMIESSDEYYKNTITYPQNISGHVFLQPNTVFTKAISSVASPPDIDPVDLNILTRIPYAGTDQTINLQYTVNQYTQGNSRKGNLLVNVTSLLSGISANVTDSYTYVGDDCAINFSAEVSFSTNQVKITYTGTNRTSTIAYKYNYLK